MVTGLMYDSGSDVTKAGSVKRLQGYSRTVDLVDSTMRPPYEKNNVTLLQRCRDLARPFGIDVSADVNTGGPFDRVTAGETEKIHTHLAGLAFQRGLLLPGTPEGNILITEAKTDGVPVATLEEGQQGSEIFSLTVEGRKLFNVIRAIGRTPFGNNEGIAQDKNIPRSRFKTIRADDTMAGDIDAAARWARSKQYVEALTIPFPVEGFRDPSGNLWRENTLVTLVSPSLHLPDGFDMLIRRVEYIEDQDGERSVLHIIPPQAYTKEELINPWA
jgi:prophage tail gpP-like protein